MSVRVSLSIAYDPSRSALNSPEKRHTLFQQGSAYSKLQLAAESARLAYYRAEVSDAERQRLTDALARVAFGAPAILMDRATGTEAFASRSTDSAISIVAFRGTQPDNFADIATDLNASCVDWPEAAGRVHAGFAAATRAILPQVRRWLEREAADTRELILTGHSLGAAIATLMASIIRPGLLVTLGSPRVGNRAFAASFEGIETMRVVNCCDFVTEIPPELPIYTHICACIYITRDGERIDGPDSELIRTDRLRARVDYLSQYSLKKGAVLIRDVADHTPINYLRAFFS